MENETLTEASVDMAVRRFGDALSFAFVGGSRATGRANLDSDIDVFVVLRRSMREEELGYFAELAALHRDHALKFDHCGEVLDLATLDDLFATATAALARKNASPTLACWDQGCILSAARKSSVVLGFLADAKVCERGDIPLLHDYGALARACFQRSGRLEATGADVIFGASEQQGRLALERRLLMSDVSGGRFENTPVGVGLERWFRATPPQPPAEESAGASWPDDPNARCPADWAPGWVRAQCLGMRRMLMHRP